MWICTGACCYINVCLQVQGRNAGTWDRLLEKPEDQRSTLADLNHAPNMTTLSPAYMVVAEFDPLQDEGAYYASRLSDHGVPVSSPLQELSIASCDEIGLVTIQTAHLAVADSATSC